MNNLQFSKLRENKLSQEILVKTNSKSYPIFIEENIENSLIFFLKKNLKIKQNKLVLITNKTIAHYQGDFIKKLHQQLNKRIFLLTLPDGEQHKTLETLNVIYTFMLQKAMDRTSWVLALGGGVIGDMAGMAAATFMRGVPLVQIPTTLLSMVDSSIGGKVAVNHQLGKNMIGAFYQPEAVFVGTQFLKTLPLSEFKNGLAEVIKHGIIKDSRYFDYLEKKLDRILTLEPPYLIKAIKRSCEIKAEVISQDEKERGLRQILNYGHTFGHALETATQYKYFKHGEAVMQGMRSAGFLGGAINGFSTQDRRRQEELIKRVGLKPLPQLSTNDLIMALKRDKKFCLGRSTFILPSKIGKVNIIHDVDEEKVKEAFNLIR